MSKGEVWQLNRNRTYPRARSTCWCLQIVALEPLHGYAIAQRLKQMSRDVVQVTQGTLYPALHRLENRGFLAADWKPSDTGRDAKFYKLTARAARTSKPSPQVGNA